MEKALFDAGWKFEADDSRMKKLVDWIMCDLEYNHKAKDISVLYNIMEEETFDDFGEDVFFVQDKRGFSAIMDQMIVDIKSRATILLDTAVKRV